MSVQSEIDRIITAVGNAYSKVSEKGGTVPASQTVANLATAIDSIPAGGGAPSLQSKYVTYTANGTNTITPDAPYDGMSSVDVTVNVASGGGGGTGFSVKFPATAVAWASASAGCVIVQADGTVVNMKNYSTLAGKTIHNVIEIGMCGNGFYYPRMTVQTGKILFTNVAAAGAQIRILVNGESSGTYPGNGASARWIPLADTVISKLEMYNTD